MILKTVCQHCDTELQPASRACDRCGAPRTSSILKAPELEAGYQLYQNAWRGFAVMFPEGWSTLTPVGAGVTFESPHRDAVLEMMLLPPQTMVSAPQHAELFLRRFPQSQVQLLPDSTDHFARALFEGPEWHGLLAIHLTEQGGTLALARRLPSSPIELESPLQKMLSSLSPIPTIPRQTWTEPSENSLQISCPTGWQPQSAIRPSSTGMGLRQPICRFTADPTGHIFLAMEPEFRPFIHQELPQQPPQEEGFFQKLGRFAQQFEHSMAQSMGEVICPFRGMGPALQHFFLPHWRKQFPGCELIGFEDHGKPDSAFVRLLLPGEVIRVYNLQGVPLPSLNGMGPPRWLGGHGYYYQAPASLMDKFEPIFVGMTQSYQQLPQWRQRELGVAQQQQQQSMQAASAQQHQQSQQWMALSQSLHQQRMGDIAVQGQASAAMYQNSQAISDMQMQGWQNSQASSNEVQRQSINGINERDDFLNANTGTVYNLSSHLNNYWDTGRDHVVGSDLQLQVPPDWTPLQRWDGRSR